MICFCPTCFNETTARPLEIAESSTQSIVTGIAASALQNSQLIEQRKTDALERLRTWDPQIEQRKTDALERLRTWDPQTKFQFTPEIAQYTPYEYTRNNEEVVALSGHLAIFPLEIVNIIYDYQLEYKPLVLFLEFRDSLRLDVQLEVADFIASVYPDYNRDPKIQFLIGKIFTILKNAQSDFEKKSIEEREELEESFQESVTDMLFSIPIKSFNKDNYIENLEGVVGTAIILSQRFSGAEKIAEQRLKLIISTGLRLWDRTQTYDRFQTLLMNVQHNIRPTIRSPLNDWAIEHYDLARIETVDDREMIVDPLTLALCEDPAQLQSKKTISEAELTLNATQFLLEAAGIIEPVCEE